MSRSKTIIITGGSQGIGAAAVKSFLDRDWNVTATSRNISNSPDLPASERLHKVDGNIGSESVATEVVETTLKRFGGIDALVNNAGIFSVKPFVRLQY